MNEVARLERGTVFAGDFRILEPLGEGGMGAVYVAEQLSTTKRRAIKLMQPEFAALAEFRKRFDLEARIAARIKSEHVVQVIASGIDAASGSPWIAMELLEGESLAKRIERGPLDPGEAREVVDQLCHALGEAHAQAIIHRDLKPENIFLANARRRGVPFTVKVLDFGIARIVDEARATRGATRKSLGTPLWMAPEQESPNKPIAPSTDVWAIGLIVFDVLTGRYFWKTAYNPACTLPKLAAEMFLAPIPAASDRAREYGVADRIPVGFDAWFARCVAREQSDRFRDAAEAFAALDPVLGHATASSSRREVVPSAVSSALAPTALAPTALAPTALAPTALAPISGPTAFAPTAFAPASGPTAFAPTAVGPSPGPVSAEHRGRRSRALIVVAGAVVALVAVVLVAALVHRARARAADAHAASERRAGAAAPPAPAPKSGGRPLPVPQECEDYVKLVDCFWRAADPAQREANVRNIRDQIRYDLDHSGTAVAVANCRLGVQATKENGKRLGCKVR